MENLEIVTKIFKGLSDITRLRIYLLLMQKKLCVCELTCILNMKQPRISHSLRVLKEAGLVNNQKDGKWVIYSINKMIINIGILQGLKKDLKLLPQDTINLEKCKKENIREK